MATSLSGKVALVTGGSRGIGAATARALAAEGADVVISYVASADKAKAVAREIEAEGVRCATVRADQANKEDVERLIGFVVAHFGRLDILVNNAGSFITGSLGDPATDFLALDRQYAVNFESVVIAIRAVARVMRDGGRIITISSGAAVRAGFPGVADYAATKAAINGYTRGAARDLGPRNITVNAIQAGATDTDLNPESGPFGSAQKAANALGRFGRPEEIAAGVVFLAGAGASFITGSVLAIDGGYGA